MQWTLYARYWTGVAFRNIFPGSWSNHEPHNINPNPYYKTVIADLKRFISISDSLPPPLNVVKRVYSILLDDATPAPKALGFHDACDRSLAWKRYIKLPLSAESRDLLWQASHEVLSVAFRLFKFHLVKHNLCVLCCASVETIDNSHVLSMRRD